MLALQKDLALQPGARVMMHRGTHDGRVGTLVKRTTQMAWVKLDATDDKPSQEVRVMRVNVWPVPHGYAGPKVSTTSSASAPPPIDARHSSTTEARKRRRTATSASS